MTDTDVADASDIFPVHVGRCVYCDATDHLSDEHVIPYGLGGNWKLLSASCPRCCQITSGLERVVQREHFLAVRTVAALPTRREHNRPTRLKQKLGTASGPIELSLSVDAHPAPLVLPVFSPPLGEVGAAEGVPPSYVSLRVAERTGRLENLARASSAQSWTFPCADPQLFARFLAKVGYCFAVGSYGVDAFVEHFARQHVRADLPGLAAWVGCTDGDPAFTPNGGHHLSTIVERGIVRVEMRLFAISGAPTYVVLVGRVPEQPRA